MNELKDAFLRFKSEAIQFCIHHNFDLFNEIHWSLALKKKQDVPRDFLINEGLQCETDIKPFS